MFPENGLIIKLQTFCFVPFSNESFFCGQAEGNIMRTTDQFTD
jgi:hypothetical protein